MYLLIKIVLVKDSKIGFFLEIVRFVKIFTN